MLTEDVKPGIHAAEPWYPRPPDLHGEVLLDVFTHRSLRQEGGSGDNERYAVLGEKALEAVVTHCIFLRFPHFRTEEIMEERAKLLSDANYEQWTTFYRFRDKLRYNRSVSDEVSSPKGAREIFHAYIGGAYSQVNGATVVNSWVYHLVLPPEERAKLEAGSTAYNQPPPPSVHSYPMAPPPPPSKLYMHMPRSRTSSFSSGRNVSMKIDDAHDGLPFNSPHPGRSVYLPRFNEIATQRRLSVQYAAEQTGLQHAPRWAVKCVVNGNEMGIGAATTKQLAKEEAAKQAFVKLGFPMP